MNSQFLPRKDLIQLPKPFLHLNPPKILLRLPISSAAFRRTRRGRRFGAKNQAFNASSFVLKTRSLGIRACSASGSSSNSVVVSENSEEEDAESAQIFEVSYITFVVHFCR